MAGAKILILGGTGEAYRLAEMLDAAGWAVTTALAGRTEAPRLPRGAVRIGGFGGAAGLAHFIAETGTALVIDATHPFAAAISANASDAAGMAGVPLLRVVRPAWAARAGWQDVETLEAAAEALPPGARVFLAIGRQGIDPFFARKDCRFFCRLIGMRDDIPDDWVVIAERGPFTQDEETALFTRHGITHLVSKNSGAAAVAAKLDAAERLGIAVLMVRRPALPFAEEVGSVEAALAWIAAQAGSPKPSGEKSAGT